MLQRPPSAAAAHRARQARYAKRLNDGGGCLTVEIKNWRALVDWLVETGRLCEAEAADRRRIAVAAGQALDDLPEYWRRKKLLTRQP